MSLLAKYTKKRLIKSLRTSVIFPIITMSLGAFAAPAQTTLVPASKSSALQKNRHGYFISIDGLRPSHLDALLQSGKLTAPHGFKWLQDNTVRINHLESVFTTLTAASHISTVTCSTPSAHGIIANSFLKDGKKVSGYTYEFQSESLWEAAKRQNKKVISLAYVGADGLSARREADYGIGYPEDKYVSKPQILTWKIDEMPAATPSEWNVPKDISLAGARQETIKIIVNPATKENTSVQVLALPTSTNQTNSLLIYLDTDKNLQNGYIGKMRLNSEFTSTSASTPAPTYIHHYFVETSVDSALQGFKRTVFFRGLPSDAGQLSLYVSGSSYNSAYPPSYREALDDANLVWPNYGVSTDKLSATEKVEANAIFDRFVTQVATFTKTKYQHDIVMFYQPLIDTIGHGYESKLPLPFNPEATDDITQAYVRAFQIVDQNISDLLFDMEATDVVELMGDHGMDPIKKTVNVAALLPQDLRDKVDVIASGTLVLLYPKRPAAQGLDAAQQPTSESIAAANAVGQTLYERLKNLQHEGNAVFGSAHRLSPRAIFGAESPSAYGSDWQFGEAVWAFTGGTGYWLRYNEIDPETFSEPPALGMHGNFINLPSMDTTGFIGASQLHKASIKQDRLLNMVPTFTHLMGMDAPRDCMGTSIIQN